MAEWGPTVAEELRRDVRFAVGWKVGKKLRPLTDTERAVQLEGSNVGRRAATPVCTENQILQYW
jgi:hypothetical protein